MVIFRPYIDSATYSLCGDCADRALVDCVLDAVRTGIRTILDHSLAVAVHLEDVSADLNAETASHTKVGINNWVCHGAPLLRRSSVRVELYHTEDSRQSTNPSMSESAHSAACCC